MSKFTKEYLRQVWETKRIQIVFVLYLVIAFTATTQDLLHGPKAFVPQGHPYKEYNNYVIFRQSFFHLTDGKNLYQPYPAEYWDLYKYSPAFAMFFSIFAYLPDVAGLTLWNLVNCLVCIIAIIKLPGFDEKKKTWILLFCLIEMLGSLQNAQSNGLMAGLILFSFIFLEESNYFFASFFIVASFFIKIFGLVGFSLFLMYPDKKKLAIYSLFWFLVIGFLPVIITGFDPLIVHYKEWYRLLMEDHQGSQGLSLAGLLEAWFGAGVPKNLITLAGIAAFCLPLFRTQMYRFFQFRVLMLASVLLWILAFNHKAESPTFIIAVCGMAIWYFYMEKRSRTDTILLILAFLLTTLSVTDLFPKSWREEFIRPYAIKGLMTVVIWFRVLYELMAMKYWRAMDYESKSTLSRIG